MSVYVVITSTWYNNFQCIHLTAVHRNIDTTNQTRNQKHLSRGYVSSQYSSNTCSQYVCMISCIYRLLILLFENNLNFYVMSSFVKVIMDGLFWQQSSGIIELVIRGMNSVFRSITLFLYTTKPSWRQSTRRWFLMKYGILLNISLWTYFTS